MDPAKRHSAAIRRWLTATAVHASRGRPRRKHPPNLGGGFHLGDDIGKGKDPLGVAHVQALDHATSDRYDAVPRSLGLLVGRDDLPGVGQFLLRRTKQVVGRGDLGRMDQGLAVETHLAALSSLGPEATFVSDVVEDAIQDDLSGRPRSQHGQ